MSKKYRFLIADDNRANVKVAEFILKPLSSITDVAANGQEALEKYMENRYDVILMDVQMPVMNGYEATQKIRHFEKELNLEKSAIIIATTANNQPEEVEMSKRSGMNDLLVKPFTAADILAVID
ncbi:response regulator [Roseimarinus sediminis]|jgi:CheY-like chemotaxis protein|uniref:response regulator n=1 Tax=Roseimarinus sediminis TaxID=1610899 RepID=UPI003D235F25